MVPRIAPFPGIHYPIERFATDAVPDRVRAPDDDEAAPARLADLTDVVCPPYDVISDAQRRRLSVPGEGRQSMPPFVVPSGALVLPLAIWPAVMTESDR